MNFDFDDTDDDDDNLLCESDTSTDDGKCGRNSTSLPIQQHTAKSSSTRKDVRYDFSNYLDVYEQIFKHYTRNEHIRWQSLFSNVIKQSSNPHELLYMFLDHTLSTSNTKKHKMLTPLIEQFREIESVNTNTKLDDKTKHDILLRICHRCLFSQLESVIHVFNLHSTDNRPIATKFVNEQIQQNQDIVFISYLTKSLKLFDDDSIPFEKIIIPLLLKSLWETIRVIVDDNKVLQKKLLHIIDNLISTDKIVVRRLFAQYSINVNADFIDVHLLKRGARKLLKKYNFDLQDFPNLAMNEKLTFLKTLFVRRYLEKQYVDDDDDNHSWSEQIKELVKDNRYLMLKLIDLFVDYVDMDSGVKWANFYNFEDSEIPQQIRIRRHEAVNNSRTTSKLTFEKPSHWPSRKLNENVYKPNILASDIVYIELDSDVDPFLNRFECARLKVGVQHLPFVGFDCETFMDPTQRTLNSQIVSTIQLASLLSSRSQYLYGIFDMLALRLQFDIQSIAEFARRLFCSRDFILLTYNYASDTSSLIQNYPSMNEALMQGSAVIDLQHVQQYILENCPDMFPYHEASSNSKSRGLSELVRLCFGDPLDKSLQTSDWRKRPLKPAQLTYSDARVLVDIALLIEERAHNLEIPWSWSKFKGYKWTNRAFRKRAGTSQQLKPNT